MRIAACTRILALAVLMAVVGTLIALRTTPAQVLDQYATLDQYPVYDQYATLDQYATGDQYATEDQYPTADQGETAPAEQGYVTSSWPTANYIYCGSNPQWRSIDRSYRQFFATLEEAQAAYPDRQVRC